MPDVRTYGPANELLAENGSNYLYDADGNIIQDDSYNYSYDEENRLTQVQRRSDSAMVGQYAYDALGRRAGKVATPAGSSSTNLCFYDGTRIIEEQDPAGSTLATYAYGDYVDEVLTMDRAGQTYYYHPNSLWSPHALTDASGSVVERYTYDAYGGVIVLDASYTPLSLNAWGTPHSAVTNDFLFTGRELDEETGLYFYRARYYDSAKGRFLQRDPQIPSFDDLNLYLYVKDNPDDNLDPSGAAVIARYNPIFCACGLPLCTEIHSPSPPFYNTAPGAAVCGVYTTPPCGKTVHATVCLTAGTSCFANCVRGCLRADWNPAICNYNAGDIPRHAACFHYCDFVCHGGISVCSCPCPCAAIAVP